MILENHLKAHLLTSVFLLVTTYMALHPDPSSCPLTADLLKLLLIFRFRIDFTLNFSMTPVSHQKFELFDRFKKPQHIVYRHHDNNLHLHPALLRYSPLQRLTPGQLFNFQPQTAVGRAPQKIQHNNHGQGHPQL